MRKQFKSKPKRKKSYKFNLARVMQGMSYLKKISMRRKKRFLMLKLRLVN